MPHIFTNAEYADMLYVYGFCDGSATAAAEEYRRRFPMRRIPDVLTRVAKCTDVGGGIFQHLL
jgi:hypothetical protein